MKATTSTSGAAVRAIENCPELNMGNYDEVGVERLNDWAIRANDEIDRLHALAAGQAVVPARPWSLGYADGNWRDIDHQDHYGVMRIVWRMEGEERTPKCEALAHAVIAALNGAAAPAQPVAEQGAAYAALPTSNYAGRVYEEGFLIGTCPLYTADQMRAFADATCALRASHGQAPADLSPTAGMNIAQRILHVGGRNNDAGYVEFGSIQAVEALVRQVLRDLPAPATADSVQEDALSDSVRTPLDSLHADAAYLIGRLRDGSMPYVRVIEIIRERIDAAKAAIRARAARAPADSVQEDAARYRWLADYLVCDRTDVDDAILACSTAVELSAVINAARKQGGV